RHPPHGAILLAHEIRLGGLVPAFEHADRFAYVAIGELELEGHPAAEVLGGDEVLSLHGGSLPNGARSHGRWEAQDRFGRDAEELLASRDVPVPAALVPGIARQIVARVEQEPEWHVTVGRDREEGSSL